MTRAQHIQEILSNREIGRGHIEKVTDGRNQTVYSWRQNIEGYSYVFQATVVPFEDTDKRIVDVDFYLDDSKNGRGMIFDRHAVPHGVNIRVISSVVTFVNTLLNLIPNIDRILFSSKASDSERVRVYTRLAQHLARKISARLYVNTKYAGKVHFIIARTPIPYYEEGL